MVDGIIPEGMQFNWWGVPGIMTYAVCSVGWTTGAFIGYFSPSIEKHVRELAVKNFEIPTKRIKTNWGTNIACAFTGALNGAPYGTYGMIFSGLLSAGVAESLY